MTTTPPLPGLDTVQPVERARPPHYLLIAYIVPDPDDGADEFDDQPGEISVLDVFDDEPEPDWCDEDEAIWDNWSGRWAVAQPWVWGLDVTAEGFARYDLRASVA